MATTPPTNPRNAAYLNLSGALLALANARASLSALLQVTEYAHQDKALETAWNIERGARIELHKTYKRALAATPKSSHLRSAMDVESDMVMTVDAATVEKLGRGYAELAKGDLEALDAFAAEQLGALDAEGCPETEPAPKSDPAPQAG